MAVLAAFIRGINVGGRGMLPMASLRALCEKLGYESVATYVQSGNVVFRAGAKEAARAAGRIEGAIEKVHGFRPTVVARTVEQVRAVVGANPFAGRQGVEGGRLLVMFLSAPATAEAARAIRTLSKGPEELVLVGEELFMHLPNGVSGSKVSMAAVEKALGVPATGRNWNTVTKVLAMAEELEGASESERG